MKFLPIGSVVLLKGMTNKTLIFGRCQANQALGKAFDYVGCAYPQGIQDSNHVRAFNHDDIDTVFALGYQDENELQLQKELNKRKEKLK